MGGIKQRLSKGRLQMVRYSRFSLHLFLFFTTLLFSQLALSNAPIGDITDTTPTFSWSATAGASEYKVGHQDHIDESWYSYYISAADANCPNIGDNCSFTPIDFVFSVGDRKSWWVKAKVNGSWANWSDAHAFTIIDDTVTIEPLELIAPSGLIANTTPTFSWEGVTNATEYKLGHELIDPTETWHEHVLTPAEVNCLNSNSVCTFTALNNIFHVNDNISWWVKARVGGRYGDWSDGKNFTVITPPTPGGIIINEVLAANTNTNLDPDFIEFSDWIELYNPSNHDVDMSNYGLSDDDDPLQWKFPVGTIIKANDYLLVWADSKDVQDNALHTNFKLSSKGEKVTLSDLTGVIIDSIDFKKQNSDISCSKANNDIVFMSPTPGSQNTLTHASKNRSDVPEFSFDSGFFNTPITVSLSQANSADIFYTTDGSIPDENASKFTQTINVSETMVIRAVALETNGLLSEIVSKTYFMNHSTTLPVISLTTDPDHLFDPKTGIYTAGDGSNGRPLTQCHSSFTEPRNYAQDWERPAYIEYFGANSLSEFSLTAGLSISGQCSRETEKKSFSVELDKKFGSKSLSYKLFDDKEVAKFKDFKFRTGADGFKVNDIIAAALVKNGVMDIDFQAYRPTQMFVNGNYWGLYNIREKKGSDFITSNYPDIDKDELDIINQGWEARTGDMNDYLSLRNLLHSLNLDLSNDADYQQVIAMIDEDNFIDYIALMIYSANNDWLGSNQRSWKEKKAGAKWRWMLDDVDGGFRNPSVNSNKFDDLMSPTSPDVLVSLFQGLTKNATFKQKFKARFIALLDSTFTSANMLTVIDAKIGLRRDYIPLETPIWNSVRIDWFNLHEQSLKDFANARNSIVRSQLNAFIP